MVGNPKSRSLLRTCSTRLDMAPNPRPKPKGFAILGSIVHTHTMLGSYSCNVKHNLSQTCYAEAHINMYIYMYITSPALLLADCNGCVHVHATMHHMQTGRKTLEPL